MRLRTSIESDLRSRIEDELRDLEDRRSHVDRFLRPEDITAYRSAVAKASASSRRPTLTDEHWLAPPPDRPSFRPPSDERLPAPPRSFIPPPAPDRALRSSSFPLPSSFPPPSFETTLRSSYPPPASSSSSVWTMADVDRELPYTRPRPRKGVLVAALVILTLTVGLFGSAATRVEIPTARASGNTTPMVACSELTTLDNPVVVATPAPTLKPVSRHRSRSGSAPVEPRPEQTPSSETVPAAASPSSAASATNPALEDAARTAKMLREQLEGAHR